MAIWLIDTLKQKNNGKFPLIDSNDVKGGFYQADTLNERNAIPAERRKEGMFCWVAEKKIVYQLVGGTSNTNWIEFKSGSSMVDGYAHIWIGKEPPSDKNMLWLDTNTDGILDDETDIGTVNQLLTKIREMENAIAILTRRLEALENGAIIIPPSPENPPGEDSDEDDVILLEDGLELWFEDNTPMLLEIQDNNDSSNEDDVILLEDGLELWFEDNTPMLLENNNGNNNPTKRAVLLEDGTPVELENGKNLLLE